ncbi:MAG: Addiction module toxin, RelE/StbE family [Candidatus Amesbacteria bacterium GW2011_GWB1_47_19]|nr:MAG: Addiction module toxin, RelE/StbE family [Candidatus Amesbacteria bacterium GW2011_GWA1_44_24]KKU31826.1 MAG: hypothetical protein UX46_C0002G0042 [Candidatus Amesbacteria bacterium GW2011_GWC1_46_24]KKU66762.1 MAG: Addiction module toxin, RelE/StbE family [Candidatus Amesbacteria bacterium GW2011_GWB1_47_19]OGD05915.1 MAG: hypothetical protein A2379_00055 [Candidatus Amesbacteria bacterium RIFOXYB1_FULL_47_13]HBC73128.1 type II toxin-antitoxin system mRNA interferase toxin, RelE/StbE f
MKVIISPRAERQLGKLPKMKQIIVGTKIRSVGGSGKVSGEELLRGYKNIYRVRMGDYRMIYRRNIEGIYIILIGHRRDIYKLLDRWLG